MIVPEFLKDNDYVGVTACSTGVLNKLEQYEKSIEEFRKHQLFIKETSNVRTDGVVSSDAICRARELERLFLDDNVKLIAVARGGDFLFDMLEYVDFDKCAKQVKWLVGSSDPTSLLYIMTTKYDIATMYTPCNMTGFDILSLHQSYLNYFKIIKGDLVKQYRYDKCEKESFSDDLSKDNKWININGPVDETGILIGGCIDVLKDLIGTKFDETNKFIEKYKNDGIIWYFDVFSMTSESLYNTLIQFKYAGWFNYTKAILIGKVCIEGTFVDMSYEELIKNAIPDIPIIYKFDVGHVKPSFTMINGIKVRVISDDNEGSLEYLK